MLNSVSLIKSNPLLPAEDYVSLRSEGIKLIEKLGSDNWTNYNVSDPGITILEAVCYAITDLSYRTDFDIKDLLAPQQLTNDTWNQVFYTARHILHNSALNINDYRKLIIDVVGVRNAWLTPSKDYEVPIWIDYNHFEKREDYDCDCDDKEEKICYGKLGVNQVNLTDAKRERLDKLNQLTASIAVLASKIKAKRDELSNLPADSDVAVKEKLTADIAALEQQNTELKQEQRDAANDTFIAPEIVEIEGLYNVMIEYEEDIIDGGKREEIRQVVIDRLAANRNLCEDFLSIDAVEYLDFGIGASIVLEEYADPDLVLAQIFFTIYKYFTPSVPFYTIDQMLAKNYQVDEIFEGPALKHGFIDDTDLERTSLFRDIMLSDIIAEISDINGVKAITYLHLPFNGVAGKSAATNYFYEWVKRLKNERKIARIQPAMSQIMFCKEREFITYYTGSTKDRLPAKMLKAFKDMKTAERKYKLVGAELDFPVPNGDYMELQDYYPVTYSLPNTYGISDRAGLPANADDARKTQAHQLSGYLLFFEQILADYLVQLDHLRDLFTFDDSVKHTYFTRALTEIENLNELLIDKGNHGSNHFDLILSDFVKVVQNLVETPRLFNDRRNIFLDHMLARFSEDLSEYQSLMGWLEPDNVAQRLIHDKINILKDNEYRFIGSERGRAYNYARTKTWKTANVSGAERRISRLLGFNDITRRSLVPDYLVSGPLMVQDDPAKPPVQKVTKTGVPLNVIKILDPSDKTKVIFTSVEVMQGCCTEALMEDILEHADNRIYFKFSDELKTRSRRAAGLVGKFWFDLYDANDAATAVLLGSSDQFGKKEDRDAAFERLQHTMSLINKNEGLHLVEHILLRPKLDEVLDENNVDEPVSFLNICLDSCDLKSVQDEYIEEPPYRKKISRMPAEKCYDKMPWVLQYIRRTPGTEIYEKSVLFQKVTPGDPNPVLLKFRKYEDMVQRISDLCEFGSERGNYEIISETENQTKYGFIIHGENGAVLAQSIYIFNKNSDSAVAATDPFDIEKEINTLMQYFGYELDLYCKSIPCDANADPYSFKTTIVLPCWPKRLRNLSFRRLVEKTILAESPAHIQTKVMWIGIEEMQRFEKAYNNWLLEMAQTEVPDYEVVNPLVDVINTLRPCGVCDDDCNHEAAPTVIKKDVNDTRS
ncbi:baseplate J/gp47 family protein [Mucilaginibacter xinganensis]|uniref:Uncharacterized protein n=1 Tax=Mucilaginibacter xinganensis TaxID=1234841 RepID=A0A223NVV7_9SPHI|nr:hypothetical protein [Mucilaginibacter xinganensis]ASU33910.1 hypothetical protein MuYL_2018 [Mucilaginibacter xinganensis]